MKKYNSNNIFDLNWNGKSGLNGNARSQLPVASCQKPVASSQLPAASSIF